MSDNINLASLTSTQGFTISGGATGEASGYSVSGAGDINSDGYPDLIIGAPYQNNNAGVTYVLLGSASGWSNINLANYANYGFAIYGVNGGDKSGAYVNRLGDINNDGYDDVIIGAANANNNNGVAYVIFGQPTTSLSDVDLSDFPTQGFSLFSGGGNFGFSVSGIGDINGDGYVDVIASAPYTWNSMGYGSGQAYVLLGGTTFAYSINLASITSSQGFTILPAISGEQLGHSVSGLGDINGDGLSDYIIGAVIPNSNAGAAYILFGNRTISTINCASFSLSQGITISGAESGDQLGASVSGAGDVNGDGYNDILIGAPYATRNGMSSTGVAYVIFGKATGWSDIALSSLTTSVGYSITGINSNDNTGYSVSGLGDVNKDGFDDIIIDASGANSNAGVSYVIYGKATGYSNIKLSSLTSSQGFTINGASGAQTYAVAAAGDVNLDGYDDAIIGAAFANSNAGNSYIVYGFGAPTSAPTAAPTIAPTKAPTNAPTFLPTAIPTITPTFNPTDAPTVHPTNPTFAPTIAPTHPTANPTATPTIAPNATPMPSDAPSAIPTLHPTTFAPTYIPTAAPQVITSKKPTTAPTSSSLAIHHPTSTPTKDASDGGGSNANVIVAGVLSTVTALGVLGVITKVISNFCYNPGGSICENLNIFKGCTVNCCITHEIASEASNVVEMTGTQNAMHDTSHNV